MMTRSADVILEWADGEYLFALRMPQIEELEAVCMNPVTGKPGIGLGAIWARIMGGSWYASDVRHIIRLGLIGGGLGAVEANRLCKTYVDEVAISSNSPDFGNPNCPLLVAQAVLNAAMVGVEGGDGGKKTRTPNK